MFRWQFSQDNYLSFITTQIVLPVVFSLLLFIFARCFSFTLRFFLSSIRWQKTPWMRFIPNAVRTDKGRRVWRREKKCNFMTTFSFFLFRFLFARCSLLLNVVVVLSHVLWFTLWSWKMRMPLCAIAMRKKWWVCYIFILLYSTSYQRKTFTNEYQNSMRMAKDFRLLSVIFLLLLLLCRRWWWWWWRQWCDTFPSPKWTF